MPDVYKQLAQAVGTGAAFTLLSPSVGETIIIREIVVVNTGGSAVSFTLYNDDDGIVYDTTTQVTPIKTVGPNDFYENKTHWTLNNANGSIGFNAPAAMTITMWGVVRT
jgi:hypothetical protein